MTTFDKNVLSSDYFNFLVSNSEYYNDFVFYEMYEAEEKISFSSNQKDWLAVVISGKIGQQDGLYNAPRFIQGADGITRIAVHIRIFSNANMNLNKAMPTDNLPSPFGTMLESERNHRIRKHPEALSMFSPSGNTSPLVYGSVVLLREVNGEYFILQNLTPGNFDDGGSGQPHLNQQNLLNWGGKYNRITGKYKYCNNTPKEKIVDNSSNPDKWWIDGLENVIARKSEYKRCRVGKNYDDVCRNDGRVILGIAHFQTTTVHSLLDAFINGSSIPESHKAFEILGLSEKGILKTEGLGSAKVLSYFGNRTREQIIAKANDKCVGCGETMYNTWKSGWYPNGWKKLFAENQELNIKIQRVHWKKKYALPTVEWMHKRGLEINHRSWISMAGIKNSGGLGRHYRNAKSKMGAKTTAEDVLKSYADQKRHQYNRARMIQHFYPCEDT